MAKTKIEWCDTVWNPTTGCTKVSTGCKNCYAERIAARFWRNGLAGNNYRPFSEVRCHPERLDQPMHWKKPRRVFVDSMSDLFHEDVPDRFIFSVWHKMATAKKHTFIVLTKRPQRMYALLENCKNWEGWITHNGSPLERAYWGDGILVAESDNWPPKNVWLGVSVENQQTADERIPWLLKTPAAVRLVSVEPMLGQVDLAQSIFNPEVSPIRFPQAVLASNLVSSLGWVICGGESGPGARPIHPDWVRSLRDQCQAASVPFFFKQWGEWYSFNNPPIETKPTRITSIGNTFESEEWFGRVGKKAAGRELDGQVWDQYPEAANG